MNRFKLWYNDIVLNGSFTQKLVLALLVLAGNYIVGILPSIVVLWATAYYFKWSLSLLSIVVIAIILDIIGRLVRRKYNQ